MLTVNPDVSNISTPESVAAKTLHIQRDVKARVGWGASPPSILKPHTRQGNTGTGLVSVRTIQRAGGAKVHGSVHGLWHA